MPLYETICGACGAAGDVFYPMKDAPGIGSVVEDNCSGCGSPSLKRIPSISLAVRVNESDGVYEQVWRDNKDGTTTIEPAAKNLKKGNRRTIRTNPKPYQG